MINLIYYALETAVKFNMKILPKNIFQKEHIGISISQTAVKAVSLNNQGELNTAVQVVLKPNIFDHGVIDKTALITALTQLIEAGKFSTPYAAITLPEYHSFTRSYTLPKMELAEVSEALLWQIEKIFPLPKNEIYFDWKLIDQTPEFLHIIIIAVKKDILDQLVSAFEQSKIKPVSFEPSASAITRIVSSTPDQPTILIEINPDGSSSSLIVNRLSSLTLTNHYQSSKDPQDIKLALQATSQSIQSLVNYYQSKNTQGLKTIKFLLTGDSASENLAKWLSTFLTQSVELLKVPSVQPTYHQAYAAAKTNISLPRSGQNINLLPDRLQAIFEAERLYQQVKSKIRLGFILIIFGLIVMSATLSVIILQLSNQQTLLSQVEAESDLYTYDSNLVSSLNKASRVITKHFSNKTAPISLIEAIENSRPSGLKINKFKIETKNNSVSIRGIAPDRSSLFAYRDTLNQSGQFSSISIPLSSLENPYNIEFSLSLKLKSVKPSL